MGLVIAPDSTGCSVADLLVKLRSTDAKPDAADRMKQRIGVLIVYLASEAPDIDIDDVGRRIEMNIPYMLEKHGARHDPAFVSSQIFEELEFAGKELDFAPVPADRPSDEIDFEIANAQHRLPHYGGAPPGESLDPCQQFRKGDRLDEIVVPAGAQPADEIAMQIALLFDGAFSSDGRLTDFDSPLLLRRAVRRLASSG